MKKIVLGVLLLGISFGVNAQLTERDLKIADMVFKFSETCHDNSLLALSAVELKQKGVSKEKLLSAANNMSDFERTMYDDIYEKDINDKIAYSKKIYRDCLAMARNILKTN